MTNVADKLGLGPTREWVRQADGYKVTVTPPAWSGFGKSHIFLTEDQFNRFQSWLKFGGMIQDLLPDLNNDQREILLSGIGPTEWDDKLRDYDDDQILRDDDGTLRDEDGTNQDR